MSAVGWLIVILVVVWFTNRNARNAKARDAAGHKRTGLPPAPTVPTKTKSARATMPNGAKREPTRTDHPSRASKESVSPKPRTTSGPRPLSDLVTVEITIDGSASRTVPIPARRPQEREIDVGNGATFTAELNPYGSEFLNLAERNASKLGKPAGHVPFQAYWSSYADMDKAQSDWYYFWRSEVRSGRYLPTDLSYIFIHVYECLHGVGFDTMLHAYGHLWAVWHKYRQQHPRLDNYLMRWMLDLNAYYGIGLNPIDIVRSSTGAVRSGIAPDLITACFLASETQYVPTIDHISRIANYDPRSGKFYKEFSDTDLIDKTLVLGFKALDDYFRETSQVGVVKAHEPKRKVKVRHSAFSGAVFNYQSKQLLIAEVSAYSGQVELQKLIEGTLKLSENILRKQVTFAGQRRGIELPPAIEERIRSVLGDSSASPVGLSRERRSVMIDSAITEALKSESLEIRAALIASMASVPRAEATSTRFELPGDLGPNELTDVDRVASALDRLGATELGLIHSLRSANWEQGMSELPSIDAINRYALQEIGEPLLVIEGSRLLVADDYRDELDFLLDHPDYRRVGALEPEEVGVDEVGVEESGWSSLRNAMSTLQLAAMNLILEGVSIADFNAFAREHGAMSSLLLDELNELALTRLGDTVISIEDGTVSVFDDYLKDARHSLEA